jgi:dCMP deaminase
MPVPEDVIGYLPKTTEEDWDRRFINIVIDHVSEWSKDPRRKVAAMIVSPDRRQFSFGYNGFPRGIADTTLRLHDQGLKRMLSIHAELNAILNCPFDPAGGTIYVNSFPCHDCAGAIIQKGLSRVIAPLSAKEEAEKSEHWKLSCDLAAGMFKEAGVKMFLYRTIEQENE